MTASPELLAKFQLLGLSEQKAKETAKNVNVTKNLEQAIRECGKLENLGEGVGMLIYHLASKIKPQVMENLPFLVKYIISNKLDSTLRVDAALDYVLSNVHKKGGSVDVAEFEKSCGVGKL